MARVLAGDKIEFGGPFRNGLESIRMGIDLAKETRDEEVSLV